MKALVLGKITNISFDQKPLRIVELSLPVLGKKEVLIKVSACGVCHTELDEIEGRLTPSHFPMVLGHQIVGKIVQTGDEVSRFKVGDRVGIGWINSSCGRCIYCITGKENLCDDFKATGKDVNGGYAEYTKVSEDFAFHIPDLFTDIEAAPLLCAGAIGYRSLILCNHLDGHNLGLIGFGASAHIVIQLARFLYPKSKIFIFARSEAEREFAQKLGAYWTGDIEETPPDKVYSAIDTTPAWKPAIYALRNLQKSGRLVINAIRKEDFDKNELLKLDYPSHIWLEKEIKSVANVSRRDVAEFLALANSIKLKPEVQEYSLEDANRALIELKDKKIRGAKVLVIS